MSFNYKRKIGEIINETREVKHENQKKQRKSLKDTFQEMKKSYSKDMLTMDYHVNVLYFAIDTYFEKKIDKNLFNFIDINFVDVIEWENTFNDVEWEN